MPNENTQKNNQPDGMFDKNVLRKEPLSKGTSDDDEQSRSVYSNNLMSRADTQVRENEDASLQDDTYAFDEDNTDNEEFHDLDDLGDDASDLTDIFESDDDTQ